MKTSKACAIQLSDSYFQSEVKRDVCSSNTLRFRNEFYYPHPSEHNKKMYLVYENKLREFVITETTIYPFRSSKNFLMTMRIAGIGEVHVWSHIFNNIPFSVYKSVEDFNEGKTYQIGLAVCSKMMIQTWWGLAFQHSLTHYNLGRWFWNGVSAVLRKVDIDVPTCISCDESGVFFYGDWSAAYIDEGYATKEECIEDNEVEVLTLDEPTHEEKKEKTIRLSVEIKESDIEKLKGIVKVIK